MLEKLKRLFKRDRTEEVHKVPKEWVEKKPNLKHNNKTGTVTIQFERKGSHKIHVPGLRQVKRLLAAVLLVFNFFIAQASLTSASASQPLALFFYLNFFVLLDYLWKTRRKSKPYWGK